MEIYILYTIYFIIGSLLGSFFSLAVHRIPRGEDITHKRSYCPNCNHRLEFFDLIPILSYITLKGKCKYCGEKIRPRYLILEIGCGLIFMMLAISLKVDLYNLEVGKLVYLLFSTIYISTLLLIGGIDKEEHNIAKGVLLFGLICESIYMIYLYILKNNNIYGYVIYLFIILILLLIETMYLKKKGKTTYPIQIFTLCAYLAIYTREDITVLTIILALWLIIIRGITSKPKNEIMKASKNTQIPIGAYLCFSNIFILILENFIK